MVPLLPDITPGHALCRQQWACVSEDSLIGVPEGMSDKVACQFFVNPVTIVGMLEVAAVPKGGWLLQTAAGSTLGRMLIQVGPLLPHLRPD